MRCGIWSSVLDLEDHGVTGLLAVGEVDSNDRNAVRGWAWVGPGSYAVGGGWRLRVDERLLTGGRQDVSPPMLLGCPTPLRMFAVV